MEEVLKDERFTHILTDRRFGSIPKHIKKTTIDKRFKRMFTEKRFEGSGCAQKRGRPINLTPSENLRNLYEVSSESNESEEDGENEKNNQESLPKMRTKEKNINKQCKKKNINKRHQLCNELENSFEDDASDVELCSEDPNTNCKMSKKPKKKKQSYKSLDKLEQSSNDDLGECKETFTDVITRHSEIVSSKKKKAGQNKFNNKTQNDLSLLSNKELSSIIDDDSKESFEVEENATCIEITHLKTKHSETKFSKKKGSPKENTLPLKQGKSPKNQLEHLSVKELSSIIDDDSKESEEDISVMENLVSKKMVKKKSGGLKCLPKLHSEQEQSIKDDSKEEINDDSELENNKSKVKPAAKKSKGKLNIIPMKKQYSSLEDSNLNKESADENESDEESLENDTEEKLTVQLNKKGPGKRKSKIEKFKHSNTISPKHIKSNKNELADLVEDSSGNDVLIQVNKKGSKINSNAKKVNHSSTISTKNIKSIKNGLNYSEQGSSEDEQATIKLNKKSSSKNIKAIKNGLNDSEEESSEVYESTTEFSKKGSCKISNMKKGKQSSSISPRRSNENVWNDSEAELFEDDDSEESTEQLNKSLAEKNSDTISSRDIKSGENGLNDTDSEESDSDDSDDSESVDSPSEQEEDFDHQWEELRNGAPDTDDITRRFAVCNMDWDRIRVEDLYVSFESFKPVDGWINSVKIYPSEFGLKRMEEEKLHGPLELVEETLSLDEEEPEDKKGSRHHREKLRQYQINRLKYYYAIVDCDSPETANALYEQLNGMEYESSSIRYDLRFVPDDMTFDHEPVGVADNNTDLTDYKPRLFVNTALQQVKVNLTWDETDPKRREVLQKAFTDPDSVQDDIRAYLASTSESESEDDHTIAKGKHSKKIEDRIAVYKKLLQSIEEEEKEEKERYEREITWDPSLKEKTEEMVKEKMKKDTLNPFEEILQKRKEKRKIKKKEKKATLKGTESDSGSDDSDEDEDVTEEKAEDTKRLAELALIADSKKEADVDQKKRKKKKKKAKKEIAKVQQEDDIKVNINDPRFSAIYTSHMFHIDPSDPHFKKSEGNVALVKEKQRRLESRDSHERNSKRARYS